MQFIDFSFSDIVKYI